MRSLFSPAFRQNVHQCDPRKFFVAVLLENLKNCQKHSFEIFQLDYSQDERHLFARLQLWTEGLSS